MTEKVTLVRQDCVPVPLIRFAAPEDLAAWYAQGLLHSLARGERALTITGFDPRMACDAELNRAVQAVLRAVTDVLYDHPEAESLTILCGGEDSWRAYNFWWNMLYAEHKPEHAR